MNDSLETQHFQIENLLRRHYLHELLGDDYERLIRFMQAVLEIENTLVENGTFIASSPTPPQSRLLQE